MLTFNNSTHAYHKDAQAGEERGGTHHILLPNELLRKATESPSYVLGISKKYGPGTSESSWLCSYLNDVPKGLPTSMNPLNVEICIRSQLRSAADIRRTPWTNCYRIAVKRNQGLLVASQDD